MSGVSAARDRALRLSRVAGSRAHFQGGTLVMPWSKRLSILAARDGQGAALVQQLLGISVCLLPQAYAAGQFAFTMTGTQGPNGDWQVRRSGLSIRYTAITALGLRGLGEEQQRAVLAGETLHDLVDRLAKRLGNITNLGDAALACWA